jgi:hypothetical protein
MNDENSYWVTVHVRLHAPLLTADGVTVYGYYRVFGLRSAREKIMGVIGSEVTDGDVDWQETTWEPRDVSEMPPDVQELSHPSEHVWYRSGRMFYDEDTTK